jgi:hypothetical protein
MPPFVEAASASARGEPYVVLYRQLVVIEQLGFLDPFLRRVIAARLPRRKVRSVALRLVTESTDRLPVKVGIALLGICARRHDERILLTIAHHPEFTDYAGMALTNAFGSRDDVLWELAKVTEGWGRIALVQQLAKTQRPEIKAWILRETGRDHMLLRGASLVAAEAGDLRKELSAEEVDDELCVAAGAILQTLIENRPTEARDSIDDYAEGPAAIGLFLSHLRHRPENLETIQPLLTIIDYLELRGGVDWNISPEFREKLLKKVASRGGCSGVPDGDARSKMDCDRRIGGPSTSRFARRCGSATTSPRCCSNACGGTRLRMTSSGATLPGPQTKLASTTCWRWRSPVYRSTARMKAGVSRSGSGLSSAGSSGSPGRDGR